MSMLRERRATRRVEIGGLAVGGGAPLSVQSMTNTPTGDAAATLAQIRSLEEAGCEIVRVAVPDARAVSALPEILAGTRLPVVADIHFDHRLGIAAVEAGVHALRFNPGNIGSKDRVDELVDACAGRGVPVRIGVNSGSLESDILERDGRPTAAGMVESALRHLERLEARGFRDVVLSLKSSDVPTTVEANRAAAARCDCPLHLGITESGTVLTGAVRSAVGLGVLLAEGIGDTIRVSLAGPPEEEVRVGRAVLSSLGLRHGGVSVIACPTCGRTVIDVARIAEEVERATASIRSPLLVAVMGCAVNGPGEAREADVGMAGGGDEVVLFRGGVVIDRIPESAAVGRLLEEIESLTAREEVARE